MATKILSDYLPASLAGITDDQGNSIVSPDTSGETAQLFGDTATRTINTMVTNGLFSLPPADGTAVITTDNQLPYFTWTATGTGITARIVADTAQSSGNVLRFTIAANTTGTATISTFIPLDGTRALNQTSMAQIAWGSATQSASAYVTSRTIQYEQNQTTAITNGTTLGGTVAFSQYGAVDFFETTGGYYPYATNAAYMKIEATVYTATSVGTARSIDLRSIINNTARAQVWALPDLDGTYATPMTIQKLQDVTTIDAVGSLEINAPDGIAITGDLTAVSTAATIDMRAIQHKDVANGIVLRRTTDLSLGTGDGTAATAITWSTAITRPADSSGAAAGTAYWTTGSTITVPYDGLYLLNCHIRFGSGTGYTCRLFAFSGSTQLAESESEGLATSTRDTNQISTVRYLSAGASVVFRASATTTGKSILSATTNTSAQVIYLGNMSAA